MIRKEKKDDLVSSVPSRIVTAWASGMTRFGATIPGRRPLLGLAGKPAFTHQALSPNHVAPLTEAQHVLRIQAAFLFGTFSLSFSAISGKSQI